MLPVDRFTSFINKNELFRSTEKVLLAVSGGRDSVLMAHFFKEAGYSFAIAHCNFMLRDKDAEADEKFCEHLADQVGVHFYSTRFDTAAFAKSGTFIQMAARDLRYAWLEEIRKENIYDYIATAHHQNDTVETILLNLVRGTGISGLHGILPKRDKIIRPLLFLNRDEVDHLVRQQNISYQDDYSNFSTKYARNKLRLEVIPKLKELNPNLEATFLSNSERFAQLEQLLNERVRSLSANLLEKKGEEFWINIQEIKALQPLHLLLFELLKPFGFSESTVTDVIASLDHQPGLIFQSANYALLKDRDFLILSPDKNIPDMPVLITTENISVEWNNCRMHISTRNISEFKLNRSTEIAQVDADKLIFPLMVRSWREGDAFKPLGTSGKKKVSDFFINQKIPLTQKNKIPMLINGNGEIIWVTGLRIDDGYKITPNTKKVYIFELKKDGK